MLSGRFVAFADSVTDNERHDCRAVRRPHRLRQGARAEIDRLVGINRNDRAALNSMMKGNSDWNHDRLVSLFGPERTDRLYTLLEHERTMAATESKALDGSKTASLLAAQKSLDPAQARPSVIKSALDLKPGTAAVSAVDMFIGGLQECLANKRDVNIAETLMGSGPRTSVAEPIIPISALISAIMSGRSRKVRLSSRILDTRQAKRWGGAV